MKIIYKSFAFSAYNLLLMRMPVKCSFELIINFINQLSIAWFMEEKEQVEIKSHEDLLDEDVKKHSWKNVLIVLIIIVVVFLFVFNFNYINNFISSYIIKSGDLYKSPYDRTYNSFRFVKCETKWCTELRWGNRVVVVPLQFPPWELESIPINGELDERFDSQEIYITFDPANNVLTPSGAVVKEKLGYLTLAVTELNLNLVQGMNFKTIAACTKNDAACEERPIVTCNNTNNATIYFKRSDIAQVTLNGNCMVVEGKDWDIVKATDRLLLYWYRIMPK